MTPSFKRFFAGLRLGFWLLVRKMLYKLQVLTLFKSTGVCLSCRTIDKILQSLIEYAKYSRDLDTTGLAELRDKFEDPEELWAILLHKYKGLIYKWYYTTGLLLAFAFVLGYIFVLLIKNSV